jgi:hypothetical protein
LTLDSGWVKMKIYVCLDGRGHVLSVLPSRGILKKGAVLNAVALEVLPGVHFPGDGWRQ